MGRSTKMNSISSPIDGLPLAGRPPAGRSAVLIVNYFSHLRVQHLLEDLSTDPASKSMVISLVDNSLDENESSSLRRVAEAKTRHFAHIAVTISDSNAGYAGGNNRAYAAVHARVFDVVAIINPDLRIEAGSLASLANLARKNTDSIVVPQTSLSSGTGDGRAAIHRITSKTRQLLVGEEIDRKKWLVYPGGHFFVLSRDRWDLLDGLSEDFFLYGEEADLMLRATRAGMTIRSSPAVRVDHEVGGTTGSSSGGKSAVTKFNASRSAVVLFRKHPELRRNLPAVLLFRLLYSIRHFCSGHGADSLKGTISGLTSRRSRTDVS